MKRPAFIHTDAPCPCDVCAIDRAEAFSIAGTRALDRQAFGSASDGATEKSDADHVSALIHVGGRDHA